MVLLTTQSRWPVELRSGACPGCARTKSHRSFVYCCRLAATLPCQRHCHRSLPTASLVTAKQHPQRGIAPEPLRGCHRETIGGLYTALLLKALITSSPHPNPLPVSAHSLSRSPPQNSLWPAESIPRGIPLLHIGRHSRSPSAMAPRWMSIWRLRRTDRFWCS